MDKKLDRKLAAILYADVAGYSRLTGEDEEGTHRRLSACLDLISETIRTHDGNVVHYAGDAVLADFATVSNGLACAVDIQQRLRKQNADLPEDRRVEFRIGLNLGEVIVDRGDIYGDGVNVAARLESLADAGGICISESVRTAIGKKLNLTYESMGEQKVKNIDEPVRAYRVLLDESVTKAGIASNEHALQLPDKPSIAVLPFTNMSGDPEQEYFSDGITEEIITALSRIRWFFVIARNSTFAYKAHAEDVREVAQQLGVRYVLEGSVRKAGTRVRVTAQLIDGATGKHVWAERYDRELEDIFAVQDEVTGTIIGALEPELGKAERERARVKRPENLDAWDLYQRGLSHLYSPTKENLAKAQQLFHEATALDPSLGPAFSGSAEAYYFALVYGHSDSPEKDRQAALLAARRAVELDDEDAGAHCTLGRIHYARKEHDRALPELEAALAINPSLAWAHYGVGASLVFSGRASEAIPHLETAIRLSPHDPNMGSFLVRMADAHLFMHQHEDAVSWAKKALRQRNFQWSRYAVLIAALGHLGRLEEARHYWEQLRAQRPDFSMAFVRNTHLIADAGDMDHYLEGLRKTGLPAGTKAAPALEIPDKPSIAVLPFTNMSGDPEQEYFADGLAEDIITELSRESELFVIARNSSFAYKGQSPDIRQIAKELGVRYVLEGSVRKSGNRIRLSAQLVEGETGHHVWAERYDRAMEDVFEVQDELTNTIHNTLLQKVRDTNIERAMTRAPQNMDAYEHTLRAFGRLMRLNISDIVECRREAEAALAIDPNYARAHMVLAWAHLYSVWSGLAEDAKEAYELAYQAARKAVSLDRTNFWGHGALGFAELFMGHHERALASIDRAIALNPNSADAHALRGAVLNFLGRPEEALPEIELAMRHNPHHPDWYLIGIGRSYYMLGRHDDAIPYLERLLDAGPELIAGRVLLVVNHMAAGRADVARAEVANILQVSPNLTLGQVRAMVPFSKEEDLNRYLEQLRQAGLPD